MDASEGEAVAAVFIKPLCDAIRDGNPVQAVIRATSVHGRQKAENFRVRVHGARTCEAYDAGELDPRDTAFVEVSCLSWGRS